MIAIHWSTSGSFKVRPDYLVASIARGAVQSVVWQRVDRSLTGHERDVARSWK
jgi:hypothetical protein